MTSLASRFRASNRRWVAAVLALAGVFALAACSSASRDPEQSSASGTPSVTSPSASPGGRSPAPDVESSEGTSIRITIDGQVLDAHLWDNAPGRDLLSRLPLTLEFSDLSSQEKIGHLEEPLSMDGMPEGEDPVPTDIGWYEPWGNVVFYYGDVGYWDGIARIGQFDSPVDLIEEQTDDFTATIELAE